ncbi:TPA: aminoacyltransferase [Staphylococcus aureus]
MYFTNLTEDEFDNFTKHHFSHYTQSCNHFKYRQRFQKDVHLLGVKNENGDIIASCLLTEAPCFKIFKYFYTHRGPIMDYANSELVRFFYENLTKYLKKHKCLYVLVDPYVIENIRNTKGEIVKHFDNTMLFNTLEKLGYKHQGYSIGYSQTSQIRWLSVLDLNNKTEDMILKEMSYQTRRNIKKTYEMNVKVTTLPIEQTERFFKLFRMAEEKHGFKFRDQEYFEKMQKIYHNNSFLKLAYIDLSDLLSRQKKKAELLQKSVNKLEFILSENPNSKKNKNKLDQEKKQLIAQNKKIKDTQKLIDEDGEILDLAAAYFIFNNHEMYYLSSGSNPKYNAYMGAYRLQWEMIKFAKKHNIKRYNFYGITGDFSNNSEDFGVQKFKEGFNAHIEEYIGDFIKPINRLFFKVYSLIKK